MKYYTSTTQYHCEIDLHSRQMYVCVMDSQGRKLLHINIKNNDFEFFLKKIAPWRHDMTVCCECLFSWYWLADACEEAGLQFVLAHALYLKAIHGGKNKNDRIDSEKLTHLLRSNLIPPGYAYRHKRICKCNGRADDFCICDLGTNVQGLAPATGGAPSILVWVSRRPPASTPER